MSALHDLSGTLYFDVPVPAAAAADATAKLAVFRMPHKCKLVSAAYTPVSAITGDTTNSANVNIKDASGNEAANHDFVTGQNAVALTEEPMTLSSTAANLLFDEGEVVYVEREKVGTGLALPIGSVRIGIRAR